VLGDVAPFVQGAALDGCGGAEHLAYRGGQGLGAVEDHQQPIGGVQAPRDEVGQQRLDDGLVLRCTVPQSDRHLRPVGGNRRGDHAAALGHVFPVDHQHLDV
jgi:hypothetical protein